MIKASSTQKRKALDVVRILCKEGAYVDIKSNKGKTALIYATKKGYKDTVRVLLKYGATAELRDNEGLKAIQHAKKDKKFDIVDLLNPPVEDEENARKKMRCFGCCPCCWPAVDPDDV